MIARGFKPVAWVAAVGGAALGCYMLSLNVASERAELAQIERQIVLAKQDIRSLQTELGTRGRLTQLEHWNAEVLALSAPGSQQFLSNEFKLASFTQPETTVEQAVSPNVRMASADAAVPAAKLKNAVATGFEPPETPAPKPMLRQASLSTMPAAPVQEKKPALIKAAAVQTSPVKAATVKKLAAKPGPVKKALIDEDLIAEIGAVAKAEKKAGGAGGR